MSDCVSINGHDKVDRKRIKSINFTWTIIINWENLDVQEVVFAREKHVYWLSDDMWPSLKTSRKTNFIQMKQVIFRKKYVYLCTCAITINEKKRPLIWRRMRKCIWEDLKRGKVRKDVVIILYFKSTKTNRLRAYFTSRVSGAYVGAPETGIIFGPFPRVTYRVNVWVISPGSILATKKIYTIVIYCISK